MLNDAINILRRFLDIGDILTIDDIAAIYYEISERDLFEETKENLLDEGYLILFIKGIPIEVHLTHKVDGEYLIKDIRAG